MVNVYAVMSRSKNSLLALKNRRLSKHRFICTSTCDAACKEKATGQQIQLCPVQKHRINKYFGLITNDLRTIRKEFILVFPSWTVVAGKGQIPARTPGTKSEKQPGHECMMGLAHKEHKLARGISHLAWVNKLNEAGAEAARGRRNKWLCFVWNGAEIKKRVLVLGFKSWYTYTRGDYWNLQAI